MGRKRPLALLVVSVIALTFVAGIAVAVLQPYPFAHMAELLRDTRSVVRNGRTELGMRPPLSNFFPTPLDHASPGVAVSRREPGMQGGLTLMSGLIDDAFALRLVDADGKPVKT